MKFSSNTAMITVILSNIIWKGRNNIKSGPWMTRILKFSNLPHIFHNILGKCSVNHRYIKGIKKRSIHTTPTNITIKQLVLTPRFDNCLTYYQNKSNVTEKNKSRIMPNYLNCQRAMQLGTWVKCLTKPWNTLHICTTNVRLPEHATDLRTHSKHHAHTSPLNTNVCHRPCISRTTCKFISSGDTAVSYII